MLNIVDLVFVVLPARSTYIAFALHFDRKQIEKIMKTSFVNAAHEAHKKCIYVDDQGQVEIGGLKLHFKLQNIIIGAEEKSWGNPDFGESKQSIMVDEWQGLEQFRFHFVYLPWLQLI